MKKEIIPIQFKEGQYKAYNESLKQWNHSQKLAISGLDISDEIVEVHFSLQEYGGGAKRMVGTVIDGVIHVDIPVFILEGPEWSSEYYNAYAWIYLSDEESAETVRKIEFTIEARPKPDEYVTPEELTFLQQLELAIQNKLDKSGHAPNKFLGTDEKGNVVTKEQEEFSLEVAGEEKLGGVKPLNKTDDMTLEVGVDKEGRLFAKGKDIKVDSELSEESENPVQNKVLTKEVIALKEHNTQLKETIEKLQIKVTTEKASFHNITDSANMKVLDFGMEGKTEQNTTSGNQLFDYKSDKWSTSIGDIQQTHASISLVDEGIQLINNVTGSNTWIVVYYEVDVEPNTAYQIKAKHNRNYPLSVCDSSGSTIGSDITCDGKSIRSFTSPSDGKIYIKFSTTRGSAEPNDSTYTEVMLATDASVYEPFTGRMPSPNPGFPQEIENAGVYNEETGRYEIGCKLFKENLFNTSLNITTTDCLLQEDGSIKSNMTNKYHASVKIESRVLNQILLNSKGKTITFSVKEKINERRLGIYISGERTTGSTYQNLYGTKGENYISDIISDTFTRIDYIELKLNGVSSLITDTETVFTELMFNLGEYIPYSPINSQHLTLTSPVPLTKWDYLTKRDGVYGWSVWSECLNLNGDSGWVATNGNKGFYCECLPTNYSTQDAYCNQLINDPMRDNTVNGLWVGSGNKCVYARTSAFFDNTLSDFGLANWKTHLNENSLVVWYQTLEEQSFHPLPDEEQELLRNIEMYYGVTNLYNDQGCPTWLTYIADPKLYLDNQLLEIKSAIV